MDFSTLEFATTEATPGREESTAGQKQLANPDHPAISGSLR